MGDINMGETPLKFSVLSALMLTLLLGCTEKKTTLDYAIVDQFAVHVFNAIKLKDFDAYLDLSINPEDLSTTGKPLMEERDINRDGMSWKARHRRRFDMLLRDIEKAGGVSTLDWVKPGVAIGYMMEESGFLGNSYIVVTLNDDDKKMVLEIEATQETKGRGRRLMADSDVVLKPWRYYEVNIL